MKKRALLKTVAFALFTLSLSGICCLSAQTIWDGSTDNDWSKAANWSAGVPDANDDVTIPNVTTTDPIIKSGTNAFAKTVKVNGGGKLTLENGANLTIDNSTQDGIFNQGTLENSGKINIGVNQSTGLDGIYNKGTINNNAGGDIRIEETAQYGIFNASQSNFNNDGKITIGQTKSVNDIGILNDLANFKNECNGVIRIDRSGRHGIQNQTSATFDNWGKIIIGANNKVGEKGIRTINASSFNNKASGEIQIEETTSDGIENATGDFTNDGKITIGANKKVGMHGLMNDRATFNNNASAELRIDDTTNDGIHNEASIFTTFLNKGKIIIGALKPVGGNAIDNGKTFKNEVCTALIHIASDNVIIDSDEFTNRGTIIENASGNSNIFENNGIVQNLNGGTFSVGVGIPAITTNDHIWTGCVDTDWATSGNWFSNTVPGASDNVILPNVLSNDPEIMTGTDAFVKSLYVQLAGKLTIQTGSSLTIDDSAANGILNNGTINNSGKITIGANKKTGESGIFNTGNVNNNAGGEIQVEETTLAGIRNESGNFSNNSKIMIGVHKKTGGIGIFNKSVFNNNPNGDIQIEETGNEGIFNDSGRFDNKGSITAGVNKKVGGAAIYNKDDFRNFTGDIQIEETVGDGINNVSGLFITNSKITIGAGKNPSGDGIENKGTFRNNLSGEIIIDKTSKEGIFNNGGSFTNHNKITIGANKKTGKNGIHNSSMGAFTNETKGDIQIEETGEDGIKNPFSIFTNKGKISVGENKQPVGDGIDNNDIFNNEPCGEIYLFDKLNAGVSSVITNEGLFSLNTNQTHVPSNFDNKGILEDIQGTFPTGGNFSNKEIVVAPLTIEECKDISPAFGLGNTVDFNILGIFTDAAGMSSVGSYDVNTNTFTANQTLSESTHNLFVKIEDPSGSGCTRIVFWELTTQNCCDQPVAVCQPFEAILDGTGNVSIAPNDVDDGSTADCGLQSLAIDVEDFDCSHVGIPQMVTLTIVDVNDDSDNCPATVTVLDVLTPTATCPANIPDVQLDANGNGTLPANIGDGSSTDNCPVTETSPAMSLTCMDIGQQMVILTADDDNGNTDNDTCYFNVVDELYPCCPPTHIIYVNENTPNDNDGSDWDNALSSLQRALEQAGRCPIATEVWVAAGTYLPDDSPFLTPGDRTVSFAMQNDLSVYGGFVGNETTLSARDWTANTATLSGDIGTMGNGSDNSYHVVFHKGGGIIATALLDGFTITDGNADDLGDDEKGGGAYTENASPTFRNCHFLGNSAAFGGGAMYFEGSASKVDTCTFSGNSSGIGGAALNSAGATTEFNYCSFIANSATALGGAIYNNTALLCGISNCYFEGNSSSGNGGGIANVSSSPDITNAAFLANTADEGSGISNLAGSGPNIVNCSFHANVAGANGGAIRNHTGTVPLITNCILWGNPDGTGGTEVVNSVPGPIVSYSIIKQASGVYPGTGNLNVDPLFVNGSDLNLQPCSPAIDAGLNAANGTVEDLLGNNRKVDGAGNGQIVIDMGAYEYQGDLTLPNTFTGLGNGSSWDDPDNWSGGFMPGKCQHVLIPTGFNVTVPTGVEALGKTLEVEQGAELLTDPAAVMDIGN